MLCIVSNLMVAILAESWRWPIQFGVSPLTWTLYYLIFLHIFYNSYMLFFFMNKEFNWILFNKIWILSRIYLKDKYLLWFSCVIYFNFVIFVIVSRCLILIRIMLLCIGIFRSYSDTYYNYTDILQVELYVSDNGDRSLQ